MLVPEQYLTGEAWIEFAGGLRDHPLLEEWKQAMADHRDLVNREADEQ